MELDPKLQQLFDDNNHKIQQYKQKIPTLTDRDKRFKLENQIEFLEQSLESIDKLQKLFNTQEDEVTLNSKKILEYLETFNDNKTTASTTP